MHVVRRLSCTSSRTRHTGPSFWTRFYFYFTFAYKSMFIFESCPLQISLWEKKQRSYKILVLFLHCLLRMHLCTMPQVETSLTGAEKILPPSTVCTLGKGKKCNTQRQQQKQRWPAEDKDKDTPLVLPPTPTQLPPTPTPFIGRSIWLRGGLTQQPAPEELG